MGIIDLLSFGSIFHSVWKNWELNVTQHLSEDFGVEPGYWYIYKFISEWRAAIIPIALTFAIGLRRAPLFGAVAILIVLAHSVIPHKEFSFVYAALPPTFVVAGLGTTEIVKWLRRQRQGVRVRAVVIATCGLWIAIGLTTAVSAGFRPNWRSHSGALRAEEAIADDPALCGLGFRWRGVWYYWTGGNSYLGRPIPMYAFGTAAGTARVAAAINYAIGDENVAAGLPDSR